MALSAAIWSFIESEGKINIYETFLKKILIMKKEILNMQFSALGPSPPTLVLHSDARDLKIEDNSIDLIVTSPPYVNALDYYREHTYSMYFLNIDLNHFKKHEIGGHSKHVTNRFRLLSEYLADMLRSMIEMNRVLKKELCI